MSLHPQLLSRAALAAALALPLAAQAIVVQFSAQLDGASERPAPVATAGQGLATLFYDTDLDQYDFVLAASGLSAPVTVAHLHGLATTEQTAPPRVDILGPGFTVSATGNSLLVGGFDLAPPDSVPAGNGHPSMSFLSALQQGLVYANVHSATYPAGEIRGQLMATMPIPEPSTWALMIVGLAAVGGLAARRRG